MPEVLIKYDKPETRDILEGLVKYLDFGLSSVKDENTINGVPFIPGDSNIDITEMKRIFTERTIDAKELRQAAWRRKK